MIGKDVLVMVFMVRLIFGAKKEPSYKGDKDDSTSGDDNFVHK